MAKAKSASSGGANNYSRNRDRRLAKHLKAHPNDSQSSSRVGKLTYRRKTPNVKTGWTFKAFAQVPLETRKSLTGRKMLTDYAHVLKNERKAIRSLGHIEKSLRGRSNKK